MQDLTALNQCVPQEVVHLPAAFCRVNTPLVEREWQAELSHHPDSEYVQYIMDGITTGFRIGFDYAHYHCNSAKRNMLSTSQHPGEVEVRLRAECELGRIIGPIQADSFPLHINRFGVIPKPHQPGRWRMIVDLSHPKGSSVNDGISSQLCSLSYASIDDAISTIIQLGRGTQLAKLDLESAYRIVPVHPHDRHLLGMEWGGKWYMDTVLPFGLRSAPKIFTALADGLIWIMGRNGIERALHYLDDYLFFGKPESQQCAKALNLALSICERLGVPVSSKKVEGPATVLPFLGILLDSNAMEIRLPDDKLARLRLTIQKWKTSKSCTKRDLLSLIGQLNHACKVVRYGRTFLRRMINLSTCAKELHHHIRLNVSFRSDLQWWATFLPLWNGVSMMAVARRAHPEATIVSDASGNWGCGAYNSKGEWFQFQWPTAWATVHITIKELLPIVMSCALWGDNWRGKTIKCICDNAAVVAIISSGRSKDNLVMHLMRCLTFFLAQFNIILVSEHLPGKNNVAADALSRNNLPLFRQQVHHASPHPTPLPRELIMALVTHRPDWMSPLWRNWFSAILRKD